MGIAIIETAAIELPDVYGLPVHRVSMSIAKGVGDEVHIVKGENLFGTIHWTHVEIWKVSDIIRAADAAYEIAQQMVGAVMPLAIHTAH